MLWKVVLLILAVDLAFAVNCDTYGHCNTCAGQGSWLASCRWCPRENGCHATGSLFNPCHAYENIIDKTKCIPEPTPPNTFSLAVAHEMLLYAKAAYSDDPSRSGFLPTTFTMVGKPFSFPLPHNQSSFAYIGHDLSQKRVVLAYRGTPGAGRQFYDEVENSGGFQWPGIAAGVLVNKYFLGAAAGLANLLYVPFATALSQCVGCEVWITGHSLGGAMAAISAFDLVHTGKIPSSTHVKVYTFGQPRTGNFLWATLYDQLIPDTYRIVNAGDFVPHVPTCAIDGTRATCVPNDAPMTRGCCAPSNATSPTYSSYHHGTEVHFPSGEYTASGIMCGYRICTGLPKNEDWSCSDRYIGALSYTDHSGYWNALTTGFCGGATPLVHSTASEEAAPNALSGLWLGLVQQVNDLVGRFV
eukprot:gnl/Spiro4/13210_TR7008_c0_g1_i2.p1 gnl/Spiro4/13210_TR7008_c0_g1~~gnl/Spiro4/13210_TR7008_c0_g1_i2.p1  ORF type:complete len:423 (+),score=52.59 gnl/Spiro4/13210_TR7008_c0_g1_i2:29-1270(+)